jgi:hypothetical protein
MPPALQVAEARPAGGLAATEMETHMNDNDTVIETYQAHAKALAEVNTINKTTVFAALTAASITLVTVTFDGGGDSGQIQDVVAQAGEANIHIPNTQIVMQRASWGGKRDAAKIALRDAIEELCFDYLSQEHGGWENNDGGQGDFTFHVGEQRIDLDFNQFYTESTNHSHTF